MQVYRGMDIGTAKPTPAEQAEVPHHLVDVVEPDHDHSVAEFQRACRRALAEIEARGRTAVVVGGTGLYVRAVVDDLEIPGQWPEVRAGLEAELDGDLDLPGGDPSDGARAGSTSSELAALHRRLADLDPVAAARIEPGNRRRLVRALEVTIGSGRPFSSFGPGLEAYPPVPRFRQVGLQVDRAALAFRIEARFRSMLEAGFVREVEELRDRWGHRLSRTARQALGYRELLAALEGESSLDDAVAEAIRRTRTFAVRQERWFRRDPRIRWLDGDATKTGALAEQVLGDWAAA